MNKVFDDFENNDEDTAAAQIRICIITINDYIEYDTSSDVHEKKQRNQFACYLLNDSLSISKTYSSTMSCIFFFNYLSVNRQYIASNQHLSPVLINAIHVI